MKDRELRPRVVSHLSRTPKDQPALFQMKAPEPPIVAPDGVADIGFQRSRRRFTEGA